MSFFCLVVHIDAIPGACCPDGTEYDDISGYCVAPDGEQTLPFPCPDDGGGGGGGGGGGSGPVTVNVTVPVTNNLALGDQALQAVGNAVSDGIQAGMDQASTVAENTSNAIEKSLNDQTSQIVQGTQGLIGQIGDYLKNAVQSVLSNVGDIVKAIGSNIGDILNKIGTAVINIIPSIISTIQTISQEIADINSNIIQPITTSILATIQTVGSLTAIIERDLHDGLQGILSIPGDIANGLSSLNAALDRSMQQLGLDIDGTASVHLGGTVEDTLWTRLNAMGQVLGGKPGQSKIGATFLGKVDLSEPGLQQAAEQAVKSFEKIFTTMMSQVGTVADSTIKSMLEGIPDPLGFINVAIASGLHIVFAIMAGLGESIPMFEFLRGYANQQLPLVKLGQSETIEALKRGFISENAASDELAFAGLDSTRIKVLKDLSVFLLSVEQELELWFRGEVSDEDLLDNLTQHGVAPTTVDSIKNLSYRKVAVDLSIEAWRRGFITDALLTDNLQQWRYTDDEITLTLSTLNKLEAQSDVQGRLRRTQLWSELQFSPSALGAVPDDVVAAGKRDGNDAAIVTDNWQAQFFIPSVETMIELYFRGVRTQQELYAVMNYWMVPEQLRDDLVQARKSLIPWRTIPTMLANNVISEAYAKQQLQAHGFDLTATNALLDYAKLARSKSKVLANGNPALTTIAVAKQLWEDGAFNDSEYEQSLVAHGYTADEAGVVVKVQTLQKEAADRKQVANDIVNLVLNGSYTIDQANGKMAGNGFTPTEMARVRNEIVRLQRNNSKTPTESELSKMVNANAITFADWQNAMAVNGYAKQWIDAFAILTWGSANGPSSTIATA